MIITICSSRKFKDKIDFVYRDLAKKGHIVLFPDFALDDVITDKIKLFEIHFSKMNMSDKILVMDVDGYIGESVSAEIAYANMLGKDVMYYSKIYDTYNPIRDFPEVRGDVDY